MVLIGFGRRREQVRLKWIKPKATIISNRVNVARIIRRHTITPETFELMGEAVNPQLLTRFIEKRVKMPKMEWGVCQCDNSGQWYRVYFQNKMKDPVVIAVAKARGTNFIDRVVYRITPNEEELNNRVKERLGDWGMFNWMRDAVAYAITKILMFVWNVLIMPQVDKIEERINTVLRDLWMMTGLPFTSDYRGGVAITFVNLANVTDDYFDYLCLGDMEVYYFAISKGE